MTRALAIAALLVTLLAAGDLYAGNAWTRVNDAIVKRDFARAERLLNGLVEQGDANAMARLAGLYRGGVDIPRDLPRSARLYQQAAEHGHVESAYMIGTYYEKGIGVDKSSALAQQWLETAARRGSDRAQTDLERRANSSEPERFGAAFLATLNDEQISRRDKAGRTLLMQAALRNNVEAVEVLVARGSDLDALDDARRSALHHAATAESAGALRALLRAGADVNIADATGNTALHCATAQGSTELVQILLTANASTTIANKNGWTPPQIATSREHPELVVLFGGETTSRSAEPTLTRLTELRERSNHVDWTDLAVAAWHDDIELLNALVPSSQINRLDAQGHSPLSRAIAAGHVQAAAILLQHGADPEISLPNGENLVHLATKNVTHKALELIVQTTADRNQRDHRGRTPLHLSIPQDDAVAAKTLINAGAKVDLAGPGGRTPLMMALQSESEALITVISQSHPDLSLVDGEGRSTLWYAAAYCHSPSITLALSTSADFIGDDNGITPLHAAAQRGGTDCIVTLLEAGHPVEIQTHAGLTPLHLAAATGNVDVVALLIDHAADVNAKDTWGNTPLHMALDTRDAPVAEALFAANANPRIRNLNKVSPLDQINGLQGEQWASIRERYPSNLLSLFR